jgi:large subunit ribosomal protein L10
MKTKAIKSNEIDLLRKELESSPAVFACAFEGLKVEEDFQLRRQVRQGGGRYLVLKNRLARQASEGTPYAGTLGKLQGMTSLAYTADDPVGLLKALVAYAKDHPVFQFKAGVVEGRVLDVDAINRLATLPGKDELYAQLLFLINSPAQRVVSLLAAPARDLAIVINQAVEKKKFAA